MNNSITYCLEQLNDLTKTNLELLKALNNAFLTDKEHLSVNVSGKTYVIPSYLSLENKINTLSMNMENLINAPTTGEAYFNFDGNSRSIEVRGYTHTPNRLKLNTVSEFDVEGNPLFKDFLSPKPFVKFNLNTLPDDIVAVNVKKIIPKSQALIDFLKENANLADKDKSVGYDYADIYKDLINFNEDDYVEYDKIYNIPIRKNVGTGTYIVEKIVKDEITKDLENHITIKFRSDNNLDTFGYQSDLTYKLFDETIQKELNEGDELVTFDDKAKMEILEVRPDENIIKVRVVHGEYLNLVEYTGAIDAEHRVPELAQLKFFSTPQMDKTVKIPLEEDQYVFIAIAPLNSRLNIQGPWGSGVFINTYKLTRVNGTTEFKNYYKENVRNIGDILYDMSHMVNSSLSKYGVEKFKNATSLIPTVDTNDLIVTQINKHLNDSTTVKNIRAVYTQKKQNESELAGVQEKIKEIRSALSQISFDDVTDMRDVYTSQLSEYNKRQNELVASITKNIDQISTEVNSAEIPIENGKYRIRGFFNVGRFEESLPDDMKGHVIGIHVEYRYKNVSNPQGNALSFGTSGKNGNSATFLFSDWNIMRGFISKQRPDYKDGNYIYKLPEDNSSKNEPSFNQIDIPISQGETVDIRLKVIYDFGYPFVETTSKWSEIISMEFPEEFLKDVKILDIISENNNDIETNRFKAMFIEEGIPTHVNDKIVDQDIVYFHKPESIASGFYTAERRVIPLKDKLFEMSNLLTSLADDVNGTSTNWLEVSIKTGSNVFELIPMQTNNIPMEAYDQFTASDMSSDIAGLINEGSYKYDKSNSIVSTSAYIIIKNKSNRSVKLYSMFPGRRDIVVGNLKLTKFDTAPYKELVVYHGSDGKQPFKHQTGNQFIMFRTNDVYDGSKYYYLDAETPEYTRVMDKLSNKLLPSFDSAGYLVNYVDLASNEFKYNDEFVDGLTIYPSVRAKYDLCLPTDNIQSYMQINPDQTIIIPLVVKYRLNTTQEINRTISFDLRTSLYQDCVNYTCQFTAKKSPSTQDKVLSSSKNGYVGTKYNTTVD